MINLLSNILIVFELFILADDITVCNEKYLETVQNQDFCTVNNMKEPRSVKKNSNGVKTSELRKRIKTTDEDVPEFEKPDTKGKAKDMKESKASKQNEKDLKKERKRKKNESNTCTLKAPPLKPKDEVSYF